MSILYFSVLINFNFPPRTMPLRALGAIVARSTPKFPVAQRFAPVSCLLQSKQPICFSKDIVFKNRAKNMLQMQQCATPAALKNTKIQKSIAHLKSLSSVDITQSSQFFYFCSHSAGLQAKTGQIFDCKLI